MKRLGIALIVIAAIAIPVGFWWWALFGMTEEVGWAVSVSVLVVGASGFVIGCSDL